MKIEKLIALMMQMNIKARLWHWSTDVAQHHITIETFLTQNEQFTDSFVESVLGNDIKLDISQILIGDTQIPKYSF